MGLRSTLGCVLLCFAPTVYCRGFLETKEGDQIQDMMAVLLSEVNPQPQRQIRREVDFPGLQDMFQSLPKNSHGNLDLSAARYALHRYFDHHNRWFVHGLHPNSNLSNKTDIVANALHAAGKFHNKGLNLQSLASLAGTFDDLIRGEVAVHVKSFYHIHTRAVESAISGQLLNRIVRDYMAIYISGVAWASASIKNIEADEKFLANNTQGWAENLEWIRNTTLAEAKQEPNCPHGDMDACKFDYDSTVRIVKHVVEKFGHYNYLECRKIKAGLLKLEEPRTGRVHLSDFYKAGLSGAWEFNEKIDYLRTLGALDESKPSQPRVIVTNYLSSWVNCLSPSKFYSVCCPNECEDYMRIIEKHIDGPAAGVDQIMRLIEKQPTLSEHNSTHLGHFRDRLVDISHRYRGKVPLHGRLFAQWMHHVFPHTCPFPHEADKANPMTPDQWMAKTGQDNIKASEEEIRQAMQSLSVDATGVALPKSNQSEAIDLPGDIDIPWSDVEDSVVIIRPSAMKRLGNYDKCVALVETLGVVGLVVAVMRFATHVRKQMRRPKTKDISEDKL